MFYIYEKNLNTGKARVYMKVGDENQARGMVREMNLDSLYEDKFYYIGEDTEKKD
jgi:hypothetical protein